MEMQRLQELAYGSTRDYRTGSPHLQHTQLYDRLSTILRTSVREVVETGLPPTVLEVGAGHGGYTEHLLASGCRVVATEMSRPSVEHLEDRYSMNSLFRAEFDPDGSLDVLNDQRFSLIVCSSVLHHITDYLGFLGGPMLAHLAPGGSFVSLQDPLWYPTVGPLTRRLDRLAYLAWRVARGNYVQGFSTFGRRLRRVYDEDNPADMVEYHVVRNGVDQVAIADLLRPSFEAVDTITYWSTPSGLLQKVGDVLGRPNTFLLCARQFRQPSEHVGRSPGDRSGRG